MFGRPSLANIEQNNIPANGILASENSLIALLISSRYKWQRSLSDKPSFRGLNFSGKGTRLKSGSKGPIVIRIVS